MAAFRRHHARMPPVAKIRPGTPAPTMGPGTRSSVLKSPLFCSPSQAENPHICCVLPLSDEFRERIAFCGSHEKFGKCLAERVCDDKFGGRDSGTNGSQPGAEGVP